MSWETAKFEYENALIQYRHYSSLRRQDMMFVTIVQGAVLTVIGTNLLNLNFSGFLLSCIAFFTLLLGINSDRRLYKYMATYVERAKQIEKEHRMSLLSLMEYPIHCKWSIRNTVVFPVYYAIIILAWIIVWMHNLVRLYIT